MAAQQVTSMREISLEGCPCIGRGRNGAVYRLPGDRIVKIYPSGPRILAQVQQEQQNASNALHFGVPTARVFDIVRCGGDIGLVLEAYCPLRWLTFLKLAPNMTEEMRRQSVAEGLR